MVSMVTGVGLDMPSWQCGQLAGAVGVSLAVLECWRLVEEIGQRDRGVGGWSRQIPSVEVLCAYYLRRLLCTVKQDQSFTLLL